MMETDNKFKETILSTRHRQLNRQIIPNFHLVWLDEDNHYPSFLTKFQEIINTVNVFNNVDQCIDFIIKMENHEGLLVVSAEIFHFIHPIVQDMSQISSIYILSQKRN